MPRTIRFHLDENCDRAIARGLRRLGIDVTTTTDLGLLAAPDESQIEAAHWDGRVLLTQDQDFLVLHASGAHHLGIVFSPKDQRTIGEIIRGMELIWECLEPDEMVRRVEFL